MNYPIKFFFIFILLALCAATCRAQSANEDMPIHTSSEYSWWNLLHYSIKVTPDYRNKFISGINSIRFIANMAGSVIRVDLAPPMLISTAASNNVSLALEKHDHFYFIRFPRQIKPGEVVTVDVSFKGHPKEAKNAPWDSGWIWTRDKKGRPWMSIACEGTGASVWLPCKNVMYDKPDQGTDISITVPDTLVAVANGRLKAKIINGNHTATYSWSILNPINNYNIVPNIGKYATWHHDYKGLKGKLDCDYWVLDYNLDKAKKHFKQVDTMLNCFEHWLGPYPFYEDSYKLVEAPFAGMEHQSDIAYGNGFENGYQGKNLSGTVWGLKWDFIMVHEGGHEWFGNSVTASTDGESWIHEGFTKYLETIYTGWVYGTEAGNDYTIGISKRIKNDGPVLGSGSSDQYNKASVMLHMIRQIIGDTAFKGLLQGLCKTYYHQTVSTVQILQYINSYTRHDFDKMFEQYLKTTQVPALSYYFKDHNVYYRWANCVNGFDMPVKVQLGSASGSFIYPCTQWKHVPAGGNAIDYFKVDQNFYVKVVNTGQ